MHSCPTDAPRARAREHARPRRALLACCFNLFGRTGGGERMGDDGVSNSNADFVSVVDNGREEGGHERERERAASSELLLIDQGSMSA